MTDIPFEDLANRLTPEAVALFREMAGVHLEATGDRMFIRSDRLGGTMMLFTGDASQKQFEGFDGGAIEDLAAYGLLHVGYSKRGTVNYRVTGEALRFYRWLMSEAGSPLQQVEQEVARITDSSDFGAAHPGGAHHLGEAFDLLWSGKTDDQTVSEIGQHLRQAIMDITTDLVGEAAGGKQEQPVKRLTEHVKSLGLGEREADVVNQTVELVRVVLRLDQRLTHIRDESDLGEPSASWEEVRRATFATAFACYELDRLSSR